MSAMTDTVVNHDTCNNYFSFFLVYVVTSVSFFVSQYILWSHVFKINCQHFVVSPGLDNTKLIKVIMLDDSISSTVSVCMLQRSRGHQGTF